MKTSQEFVAGKHQIGYMSDTFLSEFRDKEFEAKPVPTFQKLPRRMTDVEIESEMKPGMCDLGDLISFMDNPPEGTKDGNWNLFYFQAFVVDVRWDDFDGCWRVRAWDRDDYDWSADFRVFSPATGSSALRSSESSEPLALEARVEALEEFRKKVEGFLILK